LAQGEKVEETGGGVMKNRSDIIQYAFLAAFGIFVFIMSLEFDNPADYLMPRLFSGLVFVLSVVGLIKIIRLGGKAEAKAREPGVPEIAAEAGQGEGTKVNDWHMAAWLAGYVLAIWVLGLAISSALLIFSYTKANGLSWKGSTLSTVIAFGAIYLLFVVAFKIHLYPGLLFWNMYV
jgi:hypothetical protein